MNSACLCILASRLSWGSTVHTIARTWGVIRSSWLMRHDRPHLGQIMALDEPEDVPEYLLVILVPSVVITNGVYPDTRHTLRLFCPGVIEHLR